MLLLQSFLVAVVVPEKKELQAYAKQQGISGEYNEILKNEQVHCVPDGLRPGRHLFVHQGNMPHMGHLHH